VKPFEELDYQVTPLGEISLRRRRSPSFPDEPVYEVKVGNELLMSSVVNASEKALARLALERLADRPCDVLVGGLGLGYTAAAVLEFVAVRRLVVIEFLEPVLSWHRRRLVPAAAGLLDDPRCSLVQGDFFALMAEADGQDTFDAILVDIDHSPDSLLRASHADFYTAKGLTGMRRHLRAGGLFCLWSASEPPGAFLGNLEDVGFQVDVHEVPFPNPHLGIEDVNWIVLAT
jgi:spermidine synthase